MSRVLLAAACLALLASGVVITKIYTLKFCFASKYEVLNEVIADGTWFKICKHLEAKNGCVLSYYSIEMFMHFCSHVLSFLALLKLFCSLIIIKQTFSGACAVAQSRWGLLKLHPMGQSFANQVTLHQHVATKNALTIARCLFLSRAGMRLHLWCLTASDLARITDQIQSCSLYTCC